MNIPSNATLEEVIKYFLPRELTDLVEEKLSPFLDKVTEVEAELQSTFEELERVQENDGFKYQLLEEIQSLCDEPGSKRNLIKAINIAFETSYVEM